MKLLIFTLRREISVWPVKVRKGQCVCVELLGSEVDIYFKEIVNYYIELYAVQYGGYQYEAEFKVIGNLK